jgi:hypothetical protein
MLKSAILDEITRQRDMSQRLQLEVDDLKIQKQIAVQAHEADSQVRSGEPPVFFHVVKFYLSGRGDSQ